MNLLQVVNDTWIIDLDNESQVGFIQVVDGGIIDKTLTKKDIKPKEDKVLKKICPN